LERAASNRRRGIHDWRPCRDSAVLECTGAHRALQGLSEHLVGQLQRLCAVRTVDNRHGNLQDRDGVCGVL
jgi:hypothetical protein